MEGSFKIRVYELEVLKAYKELKFVLIGIRNAKRMSKGRSSILFE
jgi:hypothetical protein